jgi:hypothetical protein
MYEWIPSFLAALSQSPNVSGACAAAGIERSTAYRHRDSDPAFAAAWEDAMEQSTDDLAGEAYRRARHGTEKPVFHMGARCGAVREYSDTLTIFLLKAHRPGVYRETVKQEISGANGQPVAVTIYIPDNGRDPAG